VDGFNFLDSGFEKFYLISLYRCRFYGGSISKVAVLCEYLLPCTCYRSVL